MSSSAALKAPELEAPRSSLMASVIGTPTLRKVASWRENRIRSDVPTWKKVGSSRYIQRQPLLAGRKETTR